MKNNSDRARPSMKKINSCCRSLTIDCRQIRLMVVLLAVSAAFVGGFVFLTIGGEGEQMLYDSELVKLFQLLYGGLCFCGVVISAMLFKELYSPAAADMVYAQPFTACERYLAKLLLLAKYHVIPLVCTAAVMTVMAAGTTRGSVRSWLISFIVMGIMQSLFLSAVCFMFICLCGSLITCLYVPAVMALVISLLPRVVLKWARTFSGVMSVSYGRLGFLDKLGVGWFIDSITEGSRRTSALVFVSTALADLILCGAFLLLGLRFYSRRSGLDSGRPFISQRAFMAVLVPVVCALLMSSFDGALYEGIAFSLLISAAMTFTALRRSAFRLHELYLLLVRFAVCLGAVTAATLAVFFTGGFGTKALPPKESSIDEGSVIVLQADPCFDTLGDAYSEWLVDTEAAEGLSAQQNRELARRLFDLMLEYDMSEKDRSLDGFSDAMTYGFPTRNFRHISRPMQLSLYISDSTGEQDYEFTVYIPLSRLHEFRAELEL